MPRVVCPNGHDSYFRNTRGSSIAGLRCPQCGEPVKGTSGRPGRKMTKCVRCGRSCQAGMRPVPDGATYLDDTSMWGGRRITDGPYPAGDACWRCYYKLRTADGRDVWKDSPGE